MPFTLVIYLQVRFLVCLLAGLKKKMAQLKTDEKKLKRKVAALDFA
jgi:cell division protein FtsB